MNWMHDEWSAFGDTLSGIGALLGGIATLVGALTAGWYFLFRQVRGDQYPDLSVSPKCSRKPSTTPGMATLIIIVKLKKGGRGALSLLEAKAKIS